MTVDYKLEEGKSGKHLNMAPGRPGAILYSLTGKTLEFGDACRLETGLSVCLPDGYRARLVPVHNEGSMNFFPEATIYQGKKPIGFSVKNFKPGNQVTISAGDPIGMLIFEKSNEKPRVEIVFPLNDMTLKPGRNTVMLKYGVGKNVGAYEFEQFMPLPIVTGGLSVYPTVFTSTNWNMLARIIEVYNVTDEEILLCKEHEIGCVMTTNYWFLQTRMIDTAGILIYRKANNGVEYLLLQARCEPCHWNPPCGNVNLGEKELVSAIRNTQEQTSIQAVSLDIHQSFSREIHYYAKGQPKKVTYWLAHMKNDQSIGNIQLSHKHKNLFWANMEGASLLFAFPTMVKMLKEADEFLKSKSA
uniref:Bis(5'-nucleosyl)-tetraphosphatase [asymmetrical] n=1 Tax=Ditylenchus dipsaci TaxID=166011 RepID=A0A915DZH6_9BILA